MILVCSFQLRILCDFVILKKEINQGKKSISGIKQALRQLSSVVVTNSFKSFGKKSSTSKAMNKNSSYLFLTEIDFWLERRNMYTFPITSSIYSVSVVTVLFVTLWKERGYQLQFRIVSTSQKHYSQPGRTLIQCFGFLSITSKEWQIGLQCSEVPTASVPQMLSTYWTPNCRRLAPICSFLFPACNFQHLPCFCFWCDIFPW